MNDATIVLFGLVLGLGVLALVVTIWWSIFSKAGYHGAMGLLMLVPLANIIALLILAFAEWPIHRELRQLRQRGATNPE